MSKKSECCGAVTFNARRKGKTYIMCSKCRTETTYQKRIVISGVWRNPYTG